MSRPSYTCTDPTDAPGEAALDVAFKITSCGHRSDETNPGATPEFELTWAEHENGIELLRTLKTEEIEAIEAEIAALFDFEQHFRDEREVGL